MLSLLPHNRVTVEFGLPVQPNKPDFQVIVFSFHLNVTMRERSLIVPSISVTHTAPPVVEGDSEKERDFPLFRRLFSLATGEHLQRDNYIIHIAFLSLKVSRIVLTRLGHKILSKQNPLAHWCPNWQNIFQVKVTSFPCSTEITLTSILSSFTPPLPRARCTFPLEHSPAYSALSFLRIVRNINTLNISI